MLAQEVRNPSSGPEFERTNAERWTAAIRDGEFERACRKAIVPCSRIDYSGRNLGLRAVWRGTPLTGRHILIRCWRGLGDTIQFIRYVPLLRPQVRSITIEATEVLFPILTRAMGIDRFLPLRDEKPLIAEQLDVVEIEATELPFAFRTTLETIPNQVPYLQVDPAEIPSNPGTLNVGVCWKGGNWDLLRAIPLAAFRQLSNTPHVAFWQLQRGPVRVKLVPPVFHFATRRTIRSTFGLPPAWSPRLI